MKSRQEVALISVGAVAGIALFAGGWFLGGAGGEPAACTKTRELSAAYHVAQSNLLSAAIEREMAEGFVEREIAGDEADAALAEMESTGRAYQFAYGACKAALP